VNQFAVGSRTPSDGVVKIETLQEAKPATSVRSKAEEEAADFGPTGAMYVDDEESLLGAGAPAAKGKPRPAELYDDAEEEDLVGTKYSVQVTPPDEEEKEALPPPTPLHVASEEDLAGDSDECHRPPIEAVKEEEDEPDVQRAATKPPEPEEVEPPPPPPVPLQEVKAAPPTKKISAAAAPSDGPAPPTLPASPDESPKQASSQARSQAPAETSPLAILPGQYQSFRICVPKPYPGVQIRRSQSLEDKHNRFLQDGKYVTGTVDSDGIWVKLSNKHFLPVKVNGIQVLHPVDPSEIPNSPSPKRAAEGVPSPLMPPEEDQGGYWWTCCAGPAVASSVSEANDFHVLPPENPSQGSAGESGSSLLTPVVVSNGGYAAQAGVDARAPAGERPMTGNATSLKSLKLPMTEGFGPGVSTLPRHISNPIDPFSDR